MPQTVGIKRAVLRGGFAAILLSFFGCSFTVDLNELKDGQCPAGRKLCDDAGKKVCVSTDLVEFGCGNAVCQPCGSLILNAEETSCGSNGFCQAVKCKSGFRTCDRLGLSFCETDITSISNCGGCGTVCGTVANGTPKCVSGRCTAVCKSGFQDCDLTASGCESAINSDDRNCGGCNPEAQRPGKGEDCTLTGKTCKDGKCI